VDLAVAHALGHLGGGQALEFRLVHEAPAFSEDRGGRIADREKPILRDPRSSLLDPRTLYVCWEPAMLYRAYTPPDRDVCLAIFDSNAERYFSPRDRAAFAAFLDDPPGFFGVLCDDDGVVVGCGGVGTRDDGKTAVLTWGMVRRDRHGQGFG